MPPSNPPAKIPRKAPQIAPPSDMRRIVCFLFMPFFVYRTSGRNTVPWHVPIPGASPSEHRTANGNRHVPPVEQVAPDREVHTEPGPRAWRTRDRLARDFPPKLTEAPARGGWLSHTVCTQLQLDSLQTEPGIWTSSSFRKPAGERMSLIPRLLPVQLSHDATSVPIRRDSDLDATLRNTRHFWATRRFSLPNHEPVSA